jgi:hypothetical protein
MKSIIFYALVFLSTELYAASCFNFSGSFKIESDNNQPSIALSIEQLNCETISLT